MKLKEFLCKLFCKLPRWLRNVLCWAYREFIVDNWKFYSSADTWKGAWEYIKNIMRGFNYGCRVWIKRVFRGEPPPPIPLKKGIMPFPGSNSRYEMDKHLMIMMVIGGIFIGYVLQVLPIIVGLIIMLCLFALLLSLTPQIDKYHLGYLGERTVAEELEKYGRNRYWRFFHSFFIPEPDDDIAPPTPKNGNTSQANKKTKEKKKGDIDHVVVCPDGMFCVETKTWRWFKDKKIYIIDKNEEIKIRIEDENGKIYYDKILDNWHPVKQARENDKSNEFGDSFVSAVRRTRQNAARLHKFLKDKCAVPFIVPVVFPVNTQVFHETDESTIENYVTSKLIIGNSESVNEIFDKHGQDLDKSTLSPKKIEEIGQMLEEASRTDIKEDKELLEK